MYTYVTYDGIVKTSNKVETVQEVEYFDLNITMEVSDGVSELIARVKELESRPKDQNLPLVSGKMYPNIQYDETSGWGAIDYSENVHDKRQKESTTIQGELFKEGLDLGIEYSGVKVSQSVIDTIIRQMITGCILTNVSSKVDIRKIANGMYEPYKSRFGNDLKLFREWAGAYVEFLMYNVNDPVTDDMDEDSRVALTAYNVRRALLTFPQNIYIKEYIDIVELYII